MEPLLTDDRPLDRQEGQRLLITVHGIRTFGAWQESLETMARTEVGTTLEACHYRYGFFTVLAFLVPPVRSLATRRFKKELLHQLTRHNWSRIDIVAHSFGTHLVGWSLLKIPKPPQPAIHTVIFAGSVLRSSFPVRDIVGIRVIRLVNDCGIKDNVLLANQIIVLFTGMAGRVGFSGMEGPHFRNRYFNFGHGGYFHGRGPVGHSFMREYWLPLLQPGPEIRRHDERKQHKYRDLTAFLLNNAEPIKLALWVLPLLLILGYVNNLRLEAKRQATVAMCRQLASESELFRKERLDLTPSALLATEAMERSTTVDASTDRAVREVATLLPRQTWVVKQGDHVNVVAFSKDGRYLATGSNDNTARVLEAASGREISRLTEPDWVLAVAFSPDGRYVATGSRDRTTRVFETASGREVSRFTAESTVDVVAFSPDGRHVATQTSDAVRLLEASSGREVSRTSGRCFIDAVAFSSDGRHMATGCTDRTARVFESASGREVSRLTEQNTVFAVAFSPDGRHVATGSADDTARVFVTSNGKEVSRLTEEATVDKVAFSPDGRYVVTGGLGILSRVFESANGREVSRLSKDVLAMAFSPDGRLVATGNADNTARVFEVVSGTEVSRLTEEDWVSSVAFSPDGRYVATGGNDGTVRVFNAGAGTDVSDISTSGFVRALAFSPDRRLVAIGSDDNAARVFDVATGRQVSCLKVEGGILAVSFSADDRYVAIGGRGDARVFEAANGKEISRFKDVIGEIEVVAFSPDGRHVATGSLRDTARIFEVAGGTDTRRLKGLYGVYSLAFSPDGRYLVTGDSSGADVIDAFSGKAICLLRKRPGPYAFTSDSKFMATGDSDGSMRVYDTARWREVSRQNQSHVEQAEFSPDGRYLATCGSESGVHVFAANRGKELLYLRLDEPVISVSYALDQTALITASLFARSATIPPRPPWIGPNTYWPSKYYTDRSFITISRHLLDRQDLINDACSRVTRNLSPKEWLDYAGTEIPYHKTCPNLP